MSEAQEQIRPDVNPDEYRHPPSANTRWVSVGSEGLLVEVPYCSETAETQALQRVGINDFRRAIAARTKLRVKAWRGMTRRAWQDACPDAENVPPADGQETRSVAGEEVTFDVIRCTPQMIGRFCDEAGAAVRNQLDDGHAELKRWVVDEKKRKLDSSPIS